MMISSGASPISSAASALESALSTSARFSTFSELNGVDNREFSSIFSAKTSGSRLPAFTPMRTGFPRSLAISTKVVKFSS